MLAAALIVLLFVPSMLLPIKSSPLVPFILLLFYFAGCFFVLIWGSTQVIWLLPCSKGFRALVFFAWLLLYPALCLLWYLLFNVFFFWLFHTH